MAYRRCAGQSACMDLDTKILIVDDDKGIRSVISDFLQKHGFQTGTAANPVEMRQQLEGGRFDLIVLDVMMPKEDGLTALRNLGPDAPPVIILSAVGTDIDRVVGLELGADDYLAKPCNPRELLARIRTVLRRKAAAQALIDRMKTEGGEGSAEAATEPPAPSTGLHFQGWRLDLDMHQLYDRQNRPVALTGGEFQLLRAFAEHPRRVLTRDQLLEWSRGEDVEHFDRAIDVQLSRLRRKLADAGGEEGADLVRTVRNEGYIFPHSVVRT